MHLDVHNWFHNFHYLRNLPSKPEKGKCAVRDCFFLFSAPPRFFFNPDVIRQVLSQMYWFFKEGEFLWGSWDILRSLLLVFPFVFFEMYVWTSKEIAICGVILISTQWKVLFMTLVSFSRSIFFSCFVLYLSPISWDFVPYRLDVFWGREVLPLGALW